MAFPGERAADREAGAALKPWGWGPDFAASRDRFLESAAAPERLFAARVVSISRGVFHVAGATGEAGARLLRRVRREPAGAPAVGDWVLVEETSAAGGDPRIVHVLDRRSRLSRKAAGARTEEQVVAANVDTVFLVMGMDGDFNVRRLERFIAMVRESGAEPVAVLTKKDLCEDQVVLCGEARDAASGTSVVAVNAPAGENLAPLLVYLQPGCTVAMVGSSGAGKSTLLNALCGEDVMRTATVREGDDRGRHTTTHRRLVQLPGGGLLIDNPGIRELQLWAEDEGSLEETFDDIEDLARGCRFRDCGHGREPGCAVQAAIRNGSLGPARLRNYNELREEQRRLDMRRDEASRRAGERKLGAFYKSVQRAKKNRRR